MEHEMTPPPFPVVTIETHLRNPSVTVVFVNAAKRTLRSIPELTGMDPVFKEQSIVTVLDLILATDDTLGRVVVMGQSADTFVDSVLAKHSLQRVRFDPAIERLVRELAQHSRLPRVCRDSAAPA